MHYSQQQPTLELRKADGGSVVRVRASGLLTVEMIQEALATWFRGHELDSKVAMPLAILVDVRDVTGYGAGCAEIATRWLRLADTFGAQRIAVVAGSSVLRTAVQVLAREIPIALRSTCDERAAMAWLCESAALAAPRKNPSTSPRPHPTA